MRRQIVTSTIMPAGLTIVLVLAITGSMAGKRMHARTAAMLEASGPTFAALLLGVVVIVGGLTNLPVLVLGPIAEHLIG